MAGEVVLHIPDRFLGPDGDPATSRKRLLYGAITRMVTARGGLVRLAPLQAGRGGAPPRPDGDLHIVDNGRGVRDGYLYAATAYLEHFWHLDPRGVLAESSIARETFDPAAVDPRAAADWLAALRARFVARRHSRYGQSRTAAQAFPPGAVAVFLQGPAPYRGHQAFFPAAEMLAAAARAASAAGRPLLVKAHPLDRDAGAATIAAVRSAGLAMTEADANVHDILAAAAVTVSVNSAASVEGFLHGVPAVLCGRADFAAVAETAPTSDQIGPAIDRALSGRRDVAPFLWWYFAERCLWLDDPALEDKLLARFARAGFPAERLGLLG